MTPRRRSTPAPQRPMLNKAVLQRAALLALLPLGALGGWLALGEARTTAAPAQGAVASAPPHHDSVAVDDASAHDRPSNHSTAASAVGATPRGRTPSQRATPGSALRSLTPAQREEQLASYTERFGELAAQGRSSAGIAEFADKLVRGAAAAGPASWQRWLDELERLPAGSRQQLVLALGRAGGERGAAELLRRFLDPALGEDERLAAALSLAQERDPELAALGKSSLLLGEQFPNSALGKVQVGRIGDVDAQRSLSTALLDASRSSRERQVLAQTLGGSLQERSVADALHAAYATGDAALQAQVVSQLSASSDPRDQELLRAALREASDPEVRARAALGLRAQDAQLLASTFWSSDDALLREAIVLKSAEWGGTPAGAAFFADVLRRAPQVSQRQALDALVLGAAADPAGLKRAAAGSGLREQLEARVGGESGAQARAVLAVLSS